MKAEYKKRWVKGGGGVALFSQEYILNLRLIVPNTLLISHWDTEKLVFWHKLDMMVAGL